ncbi:MAG: S26 family signal peptidase [Alphaproteobacteria bacterium]
MVVAAALLAAALVAGPAVVDPRPVLLWNASASLPIGLYRVGPVGRLQVGDLVVVMPPEPLARMLGEGGYLPRRVPLLKQVAALPGQTVCRIGTRIVVDGVAMAEARSRDRRGRPLPVWQGCRVIAADAVFLINERPDSLDGRYFGPLPRAAILGRASPIWTFEVP